MMIMIYFTPPKKYRMYMLQSDVHRILFNTAVVVVSLLMIRRQIKHPNFPSRRLVSSLHLSPLPNPPFSIYPTPRLLGVPLPRRTAFHGMGVDREISHKSSLPSKARQCRRDSLSIYIPERDQADRGVRRCGNTATRNNTNYLDTAVCNANWRMPTNMRNSLQPSVKQETDVVTH